MFIRRVSALLFAPNDDPTDPPGGGGGGGGGGNNPPPDPPQALSIDDVGKIVNTAITSHLKRLNIPGQINDAIGTLKLDEKFDGLSKVLEGLKPTPAPAPSPGGGGSDPAKDEEFRTLKKQFEALSKKAEEAEAARLQAEANARQVAQEAQFNSGRQRLYESLKEHASPDFHDVWVDHLIHHKRLKVEEGVPLLEVEYSPVKGMPKQKDFLPLDEALPHLIESAEAKRFMAAPSTPDPKNNPGPKGGRRPTYDINSKNPLDRVQARFNAMGTSIEEEFG